MCQSLRAHQWWEGGNCTELPKAAEIRGDESTPCTFVGSDAAQLQLPAGLISAQALAKPEEVSGLIVPINAMLA